MPRPTAENLPAAIESHVDRDATMMTDEFMPHRTIDHVGRGHLNRYCDELRFRYKHRKVSDGERAGLRRQHLCDSGEERTDAVPTPVRELGHLHLHADMELHDGRGLA